MQDGESLRQRFYRVMHILHTIALCHLQQKIVIVTHGGVLDDVGRLLHQTPFNTTTGLKKLNTGVCIVEFYPFTRITKQIYNNIYDKYLYLDRNIF